MPVNGVRRIVVLLVSVMFLLMGWSASGATDGDPAIASRAGGTADSGPFPDLPAISLDLVATGLINPLLVTHAGDGSGRAFIVEQRGTIRVLDDGTLDPGFYLDIRDKVRSGGERGLLGVAFDPDFETNGRLFVSYTNQAGDSVLERLDTADPAAGTPDPDGTVLLVIDQPFSNHNGGHIAFGPDGYLYWGLGDGGSAGDPQGHGQNMNSLLGKMLRLDVSGDGYAIPSDNPFASGGARAEIWASGLRNPWRWSFDRELGDLWIADVGQNLVEEVNYQPASSAGGEDYGWRVWEGHNWYNKFDTHVVETPFMTFPVAEYNHVPHCSITGGYVYRGPDVPGLDGIYVYGDFCSGFIWGAVQESGIVLYSPVLLDTQYQLSSFGEDENGSVYAVHHGGRVYKIVAA